MTALSPVRIGLYGEFQVGKSLLVNCLLGDEVALVGDGFSTTPFPITYQWGEPPSAELLQTDATVVQQFASPAEFVDHLRKEHGSTEGRKRLRRFHQACVRLPLPKLRRVALVDLPGCNADEADDHNTDDALKSLDFVVFVTRNKGLIQAEQTALRRISENRLPVVMVLNCYDNGGDPSPTHPANKAVAKANAACGSNLGVHDLRKLADKDVLLVNAAWHRPARVHRPDSPEEQQQNADFMKELQDFVFPEPERSVGANAPCLARFHRAVREWALEAKAQVGVVRSTINHH